MSSAVEIVNTAWNRGYQPPPQLSVWEWMDANMLLAGDSPEPGEYRSERTPFVRGPAECLSPSHPATSITWMKGSQVGATTLSKGWTGYRIDREPVSMIITLPSEGVAKEWSNQRLDDLVKTTPCLQGKILDARKRGSGNTTFWKRIVGTGAFLKITWSSSAAKLRSTPAGALLSDEVDGFMGDVEGEGDPLGLLNRRATNWGTRAKHFKISTPGEAPSRIEREFREGDQRYYFVPCPHCGYRQVLWFGQLRWEKGKYGDVAFHCISCEQPIPERYKTQMLAGGMWVATKSDPELAKRGFAADDEDWIKLITAAMAEERTVSFHLSALYSPLGWYSWESVAKEWEKAQTDRALLKVFVNTVLGESWIDRGEAPEWEGLYLRRRQDREPGSPAPMGVLFQMLGADVQGDRIEVERVGWGRELRSWSLDYKIFRGNTETDAPWLALEEYLKQEFPHEAGITQPIVALAVDTGHFAPMVYKFARRHPSPSVEASGSRISQMRTVILTKGGSDRNKLIEKVTNDDASKKRGGLRLYWIGTHFAKQEFVLDWLRKKPLEVDGKVEYPGGYCEFPNYDPWIFQGYCAESRVQREGGKTEWTRDPSVRNEPLDCRLQARLAAALYGADRWKEADWLYLESLLKVAPPASKIEQPVAATSAPFRPRGSSSWMRD